MNDMTAEISGLWPDRWPALFNGTPFEGLSGGIVNPHPDHCWWASGEKIFNHLGGNNTNHLGKSIEREHRRKKLLLCA